MTMLPQRMLAVVDQNNNRHTGSGAERVTAPERHLIWPRQLAGLSFGLTRDHLFKAALIFASEIRLTESPYQDGLTWVR